MIKIDNLSVAFDGAEVVKNVTIEIAINTIHVVNAYFIPFSPNNKPAERNNKRERSANPPIT